MAAAIKMEHGYDPSREIVDKVGDLSGFDIYFSNVLVGVYVRPDKTKGGIFLTSKTTDEDLYQGKVGLVLKTGPRAFVDEGDVQFHGQSVNVGDWIVLRPSSGWEVTINDHKCRILRDVDVKMRVPAPDVIW